MSNNYKYQSDAMKKAKMAAAAASSVSGIAGAAAGFASVLFSSRYGRELRSELRLTADVVKAKIAAEAAMKLHEAKTMSRPICDVIVQEVMAEYLKSAKMAERDTREIEKDLNKRWKHILKVAKSGQSK